MLSLRAWRRIVTLEAACVFGGGAPKEQRNRGRGPRKSNGTRARAVTFWIVDYVFRSVCAALHRDGRETSVGRRFYSQAPRARGALYAARRDRLRRDGH